MLIPNAPLPRPGTKSWAADGEHFCQLTSLGDRADVSVSYPSVIRSSDGDYHLIYTYAGRSMIKYLHLPKDWIRNEVARVRFANSK
jgi:predicted neuraminidase